MGTAIGSEDLKRILTLGETIEASNRREVEARAAFVHDRTSESREAWKVALVDQQEAHSYYWAVAWEFVELLCP